MSTSKTVSRRARLALVLGVTGLLAACVQQPKSLYSWQAYQPSVYAYLKDDGADYVKQIDAFEKNIETARASSQTLPPGFRAHLGLLYLKTGDADKGVAQLEAEQLAFPESAPYMAFLMRNAKPGTTAPGVAVATPDAAAVPALTQPATPNVPTAK
ncbi:DUF4810 domain-containing protein [Pseudomonadota bacterium AL_CKDN230030165-1A_HGKHYDSX7]